MRDFSFSSWWQDQSLDEVVKTHLLWDKQHSIHQDSSKKDVKGLPYMDEPGFRETDRKQIERHYPKVEEKLDQITQKLGVHWIVTYLEPPAGTEETDAVSGPQDIPPELAGKNVSSWQWFNSAPGYKARSKENWGAYKQFAQQTAEDKLKELMAEEGVNPNNTIVYVKPTSRVHGLDEWQQMHNIGHAIWDYAKQNNAQIRAKFVRVLRDAVRELQQRFYDPQTRSTPTAAEITIMLGRLTNVETFMRAAASMNPKQLDSSAEEKGPIIDTAFNSFAEAMYDLIAMYFNNNGKINLYPRGAAVTQRSRTPYPDRQDQIPVPPALAAKQANPMQPANLEAGERPARGWAKFQTRDWVWQKMGADKEAWQRVGEQLTAIVDEAILSCTWAKIGGPIYATTGYITTKP